MADDLGVSHGEAVDEGVVGQMEDVRRIGGDEGAGARAVGEGIVERDGLGEVEFEQTSNEDARSVVRGTRDDQAPLAAVEIIQDMLHLVFIHAENLALKQLQVRSRPDK